MKRKRQPAGRSERRDPLAHRPAPIAAPLGRPARPTSTPGGHRRNRYRIPPVVAWNRRLRALRNWLLTAFLCEVVWLGLHSPALIVQPDHVTVQGATVRPAAEIRRIARLTAPVNLFRAPTRRAVRLLRMLPEVASVRVERRLPDTLRIVVVERAPLASVLTPGGCWVIDGTGDVFRQVPAPLPGVPVLITQPAAPLVIGKPIPLTALPVALTSLRSAGKLPLLHNMRFHIEPNGDAWIENANGLRIRMGQLDDAPERLDRASRILSGPNGADVVSKLLVLDLTSPGNEFYKIRPEYRDFRFRDRIR